LKTAYFFIKPPISNIKTLSYFYIEKYFKNSEFLIKNFHKLFPYTKISPIDSFSDFSHLIAPMEDKNGKTNW